MGYTKVSNELLRFPTLSLKAKGLAMLILSLPNDWKFSAIGLASICKEKESGIRTAINELENQGLLIREQTRNTNGTIGEMNYKISFESVKRDFTKLDNSFLRCKDISLRAKALYGLILSLPEEWNLSCKGLTKILPEGTQCISVAMKELETAGLIIRTKGTLSRTALPQAVKCKQTKKEEQSKD